MKRMLTAFAAPLAGLVMLASASAATAEGARFYDGLVMFNEGRYQAAAATWLVLALHGDANAQSALGYLYYKGLGAPRDVVTARMWFTRAAEKGIVQAQVFLAMIYQAGDGVPANQVIAYMWSDIALAAGYEHAIAMREMATRAMTDADIEEAQRLAVEWREAHLEAGLR